MRLFPLVLAFSTSLLIVAPILHVAHASDAVTASAPDMAAFDKQINEIKQAMMGDPNIAHQKASAAVTLADSFPDTEQGRLSRATALWLQGESLIGLNRLDEARPVIARALENVEKAAPDTKLHGDLLRASGAIAAMSGKMQEALGDFLKAHDIFRDSGVPRSQAIALQDIGQIYFDARDFDRVLKYYSRSVETFDEDPWLNLTTYNNRAQVYRELGDFGKAEAEYLLALKAAEELGSPMLQARILTNLASTQVKAEKLGAADRRIAQAGRLVSGAEAAGWRPFVSGVRAEIAAARGQHQRAAGQIEATFAGMNLEQTDLPFREFHRLASDTYEKLGNQSAALAHLKAFQRLDSQASELTASTSAQLMEARFDFATQNLRISQLKQGQLERDIRIEKQKTEFRTRLFAGVGIATAIIFALLLYGFFSIRKSRNEVRTANTNLTKVNVDLEEALQAKTEFLATTSHEIRTPLNGILGMAEVLLRDRKITPDTRDRIEAVQGAGQSMKALVDDILDMAKMETGEVTLDTRDTNLSNLLGDMLTLWHENARNKDLAFDVDFKNVPNNVRVDGNRLKQILLNLVSNALKFTDSGKIALAAELLPSEEQGNLSFTVSDSGEGIAADQLERIFEPFTQVNSSMTREKSGTGLGLSICKRLIDAMDGTISVTSELGVGSVFTISIPVRQLDDELLQFDVANIGLVQSLKQASVLMIDNNPKTHALLRTLLVPECRKFEIADTARKALDMMDRENFDHVIVEGKSVAGPESGADILSALRTTLADIRERDAFSTLLAAPTDELTLPEMAQLRADQVIIKPIGLPDLVSSLRSHYSAESKAGSPGEQGTEPMKKAG